MIPDLVEIPAGTFSMGSNAIPDASPQHQLELEAFRIGKYPVTNVEYGEFVDEGGYLRQEWWTEMGWRWLQSRPQTEPGFWREPYFNEDRQPVVGVSWYEAVAYCRWLSGTTMRSFRLPTEAEWEKAARGANDARRFPWGDRYEPGRANTGEAGIGSTARVDAYPRGASPYGVLDLAGNVFEWTSSKWGRNWQELEYLYPYRADDGREEEEGSAARVMRGGSWFNSFVEAQISRRARFLPGSRGSNIGFRVVEVVT
jgi:formylglycine-generating enzyme required for sulfatase activity